MTLQAMTIPRTTLGEVLYYHNVTSNDVVNDKNEIVKEGRKPQPRLGAFPREEQMKDTNDCESLAKTLVSTALLWNLWSMRLESNGSPHNLNLLSNYIRTNCDSVSLSTNDDIEDSQPTFELFDDASVLTADSSMAGLVELTDDDDDDDDDDDTSTLAEILALDTSKHFLLYDSAPPYTDINEKSNESAHAVVQNAIQDVRLMSFLLEFCSPSPPSFSEWDAC